MDALRKAEQAQYRPPGEQASGMEPEERLSNPLFIVSLAGLLRANPERY